MSNSLRHLVLILGDQLDADALALADFDPAQDALWMAEVAEESTHIPSSKQRSALFLSAMRHFAADQRALGRTVLYTLLDAAANTGTLAGELTRTLTQIQPQKLVLTAPGDWRVLKALQAVAREHDLPLELKDDTHFITTVREFAAHAHGRKQLRLEYFYREVRRKTGLLMEGKNPIGGQWNFDADNRGAFPASGPEKVPPPLRFAPDAITTEVIALVKQRFANNPGQLDSFAWPVSRTQALAALEAFIRERLPLFGQYQDAMWQGEVWLYHSHLSAALNLKLLHPLEVARAAEQAYHRGEAPLEAVEGFIRQVIGWREYVRGIYWTQMPEYIEKNALQAEHPLPVVYWTGESEMACMRDAVQQTLAHGYAHHIQRLMVTGLYALLFGARPQEVHAWYLGVYVDAVEWVELPNTLGMSQFADGGLMASKPYAATGKYIQRMSNYCKGCRYKPDLRTGPDACPMTTLYWDFLLRHEPLLVQNPRMVMQVRNLQRISDAEKDAIRAQAAAHRQRAG
ncbi:MAG: cryptochrome/photolyase family protein [Rhodocyclaceae bacterium]|nr:cryptochrome/photolyase family protein [Rhodocyclaceae bacterium]